MKCEEIDFLECVEGHAPREIVGHIAECSRCHPESDRFLQFSKIIGTHYVAGKKAESELEKRLKSVDPTKIRKIPVKIEKKIFELREKRLTSKLVHIFGKDRKTRNKLIESILTPQSFAIAASPKDITKAKKSKTRRKK